jgi:hypothetical protein
MILSKTYLDSSRDQDLNVDLTTYDSTSITVVSDKDGEGAEFPLLVETDASSGIFTGMLSTVRSASLGLASTGSLNMIEGNYSLKSFFICKCTCLIVRSAGNTLQGIYKDVCPPSGPNARICGHDANGKQIPCGASCPPAAKCYDPTIAPLQAGVFGNLLLSSSITTSVSPDMKIENISLIFGESFLGELWLQNHEEGKLKLFVTVPVNKESNLISLCPQLIHRQLRLQ